MTARYEVLLLYWSTLLGEHGLSSACPPLIRVMGGPRKTDQFVWSLSTVRNTAIYHCLDQTGYGLRHLGIIPSMVASHHQPLNQVHEPNVQTCSSPSTEHDYCRNDSVISRVKLTFDSLNPAHVLCWWVNSPLLGHFCFKVMPVIVSASTASNISYT